MKCGEESSELPPHNPAEVTGLLLLLGEEGKTPWSRGHASHSLLERFLFTSIRLLLVFQGLS